jgi:hypothetical protein
VNRQHSQSVGRFMRVDPVKGSISTPQSLNRYAYVRNNPANAIDCRGLCPEGCYDDEEGDCDCGDDDGELGDGGMTTVDEPPAESTSEPGEDPFLKLANAILTKKGCAKFFRRRTSPNGMISPEGMLAGLQVIIGHADWNDVTNSPLGDMTFRQLIEVLHSDKRNANDVFDLPAGATLDTRVGEYLSSMARAFTIVPTSNPEGVVFYGSLFNNASPLRQGVTIVHEALHIIFSNSSADSHLAIAQALGIHKPGGDPSAEINNWLEHDCSVP